MLLVKDGDEADDQQEGDKQDQGTEFPVVGLHVCAAVPAGCKIDGNRYDEEQPHGDPYQELSEDLFPPGAVMFPILDKILLFLCKHGRYYTAKLRPNMPIRL
jgi:hypothetical protein